MSAVEPTPDLESVLRELGSQVVRGGTTCESPSPGERLESGVAAVDLLLEGGIPRGCISEIYGAASCGKTSLALSLLAATTRACQIAAVVDASDAFAPEVAVKRGVDLRRTLWARATSLKEALHSTEALLRASGFSLVILDLARKGLEPVSSATWIRLARTAAKSQTALLVLSEKPITGSSSALSLELCPGAARFSGMPLLLDGLDSELVIERQRGRAPQRRAPVCFTAPSATQAPAPTCFDLPSHAKPSTYKVLFDEYN